MNKENIMDIDKEILSTSCFDSDEPPSTGPLKSESDWKWQLGNSITTIEQLKTHLELEEGDFVLKKPSFLSESLRTILNS
jgi:L-lysine 2,3-aminomutase